ncbi:MAG TPA: malto-oligosyltrehalose trehalohydrolase [Thermohalobaculum sp.]|nr:malto-oligosyltrehalose trehalohydrolase [Thermohalobaculum sp.]
MSRAHFAKSWGAEPVGEGRWRFRLWAPSLGGAAVRIEGETHGLDRAADGWFETELPAWGAQAYAFVVDGRAVPDPAARMQEGDVHGPSLLLDPASFAWECDWRGRPWHETVLYELHVGTFSETGDFQGVRQKLDHLAETGVTAIELCPVAQFSGRRGWGYDGVLLYAPHRAYSGADALKWLVDAAHARGLMVFLDVVYNHFGPDGNYLHAYAPEFFDPERRTPWGDAIDYRQPAVRSFFIENALYWLEEYRIDGLRLDAIDTIADPTLVADLARAVRAHGFTRPVHLTTEDDRNITHLHARNEAGRAVLCDGEWNDDFHHVAHVLATGEDDGYYADYTGDPRGDMVVALRDGFVQQGRPSAHRGGAARGEPSAHLPPVAFVNFLQNHDQTGNRAFGERLTTLAAPEAVEVLTAILLLSPMIPLVFMGEEWGETRPFQFFCDFQGELAEAVRQGRRREFARWRAFADAGLRESIPDPNSPTTFERSKLDWAGLEGPAGKARRALVRELLRLRRTQIVPRLPGMAAMNAEARPRGERGLEARWTLGDGSRLGLVANLGGAPLDVTPPGREIFRREIFRRGDPARDAWAVCVTLEEDAP